MPKVSTYACEVCGKQRNNDANHWWLGYIEIGILMVKPFNDKDALLTTAQYLCGLTCAATWFQKQLGTIVDKLNNVPSNPNS